MLLLFQESMGDLHDPRSVELERAVTDATIHCAKKEKQLPIHAKKILFNTTSPHVSDFQRMDAHGAASDP